MKGAKKILEKINKEIKYAEDKGEIPFYKGMVHGLKIAKHIINTTKK